MQRWFLSYHSPDQALAEQLKAAIESKDPDSRVFFAPANLRAGGSWSAQLAQEIAESTAFILLIGEAGIGKWQVPEYDEALDKWVKSATAISAHRRGAARPDRAGAAVPAPTALDRHAATRVRKGRRPLVRCRVRRRQQPRRAVALHVALSRPRGHGGKGQRLLLWPQARDRGDSVGACRRARTGFRC